MDVLPVRVVAAVVLLMTEVKPQISVVIPVYKDAYALSCLLSDLKLIDSIILEIIVVDGSKDSCLDPIVVAEPKIKLVRCSPQRAGQMNYGAKHANGRLLWFLHADTRVPRSVVSDFDRFMRQRVYEWGRFNVQLDAPHKMLKVVAGMMNWRSRLSSICTGDQAIFVLSDTFSKVGGFPDQALMEDIELSKALKAVSKAFIPQQKIVTSSRKWLTHGIFKTIRLMWYLRFIYWLGASPERIHQLYYKSGKN